MKKLILIYLVLTLVSNSFAQDYIIDKNVSLKKGIYKSFDEFKRNAPSLDLSYELVKGSSEYGKQDSKRSIAHCYVKIPVKEAKAIGYFFGICDGESIYINTFENNILSNATYSKLLNLGRYCYYEFVTSGSVAVYGGGYAQTINTGSGVLDFNDGKKIILSKKELRRIIESDEELLARFTIQKPKPEHFMEYILEYSDKHNDEVMSLAIINNIDSLIYKNETDSSYQAYYERVLSYTTHPHITNIEYSELKFNNDLQKSVGLKCKHKMGKNSEYYYKIGTWKFYYKNGNLKEVSNFDFIGKKHGKCSFYDENGVLVEEKQYKYGVEL